MVGEGAVEVDDPGLRLECEEDGFPEHVGWVVVEPGGAERECAYPVADGAVGVDDFAVWVTAGACGAKAQCGDDDRPPRVRVWR
ncbi:hypothetical protein GCM10009771_06550 [Nesterenkonia flava]